MRRKLYETNALNTITAFGYCQCGALESVTYALNTPVQQTINYTYDKQGNTTVITYPDGSGVTNKYDSLRRVTNVLSGFASLTNTYNNQGLVVAVSNAFGRVQSATYDILDRGTNSVDANGVSINSTYDNLNRLLTRTYPDTGQEKLVYTLNIPAVTSYTNQLGSNVVNYTYDALGRKTNEVYPGIATNSFAYDASGSLTNLTDGKGQVTRWTYDVYGRVFTKKDANCTNLFTYTYYPTGWLSNRVDALSKFTKYSYDAAGDLTRVVYPSRTNSYGYDALSRVTNIVDTIGSSTYPYNYTYTSGGSPATEDGPWDNDTVSYAYANRLRSGLTLLQPNASSWTQSYGYDAGNRLQTLTSPAGAFAYTYKGPGNLVTNLALPNASAVTNAFDSMARLTGTWLKHSSGAVLNSHTYGYNLASQRTVMTNVAGNYLNYAYDNIGELKTAKGYESGGSSRLQEQFGYAYDAAGNLNSRTNNALVQTFGVNNLNELTNVTRSGTLTVAGGTSATASSVTVADNGNSAVGATLYADNMFARTNVALANGNNTFTAVAQDSYGRQDTNAVTVNLPSTVSYIYDLNGNLTSDGTRGFDYDDENQLIRVTVTNTWKSEFTYDGRMRRRIRKEFTWQNSAWSQTAEVRYIYDGFVAIQERDGNNLATLTLTRGRDLSGSLQGAGGIGGLLARTDAANGQSACYHTDGNGNVTAMVNAQQIVVAKYTYDPFGNTLSKSGPLADANTYRFSSQEYHQNSGLLLYLRRAYEPNLQRWLNRDPIAERGGINLYRMVGNNPINVIDPFGEAWYNPWTWFDPNPGDNVELANGDWYGPALTKPDGILTPLSGGRENLFSDFKDDVHRLGNEIGKELAVNGAMMLIPEEEALGIVGKWLKKLKPAKSCEKIPKIPGNPFKGKKAAQDAFNHLEKYHGLDPAVASERLHKLKEMNGLGAADNAVIGKTGDVYNPHTGEWLGSLTDPTLGK